MSRLVSGTYADRFVSVVAAFEKYLASTPYGGASMAVYQDGIPVIDVWGGFADITSGKEWAEDTTAIAFSCSKSVSAIVVLRLAEQGILELDAPVATYWPEFGRHGKDRVTVRDVMAHRAGVPLVDAKLSREQVLAGAPLVEALADQVPLWEPGTAHAYHAVTVGALLGEIVRRTTGRSLGTVLREDLAAPLGLDLRIGVPETEQDRVAVILPSDPSAVPGELRELIRSKLAVDDRAWRALTLNDALRIPLPGVTMENAYNSPEVRAAELPAANAIGTARSFAKLHAALVGPVDDEGIGSSALLSEETVADATRAQSKGAPAIPSPVETADPVWASGFELPFELRPMVGPTSFGHDGAAGGLCFADRDARLGFAFLPSVMGPVPDIRVNAIVEELRRHLS